MVRRRSARTASMAALVALLAGCTDGTTDTALDGEPITASTQPTTTVAASSGSTASEPEEARLEWSACDGLECATLEVPLDHADPDGPQIEIAVIRVPATGPASERIGSLVFNPGGPGGSGVDFIRDASVIVPDEVAARFDLVGFDPRGVGASSAVDCDLELDDAVPLLPADDDGAWEDLLSQAERDFGGCPAEALELAPYVGTNNAARDLDLLRAALGDEQLSYLGYSYGTRLGATYAELFPHRVRALVLDAAVEPTNDMSSLGLEQAEGFDQAFERFAAACDADPDCLLGDIGTTIEVFRAVEAEILEVGSLSTDDGGRVLTPGEFYLGVVASLYSVEAWPFLDQALFTAEALGDGSLLQVLADNYNERQPDGTYSNSAEANAFINCADDPARLGVDEVRALGEAMADRTEYFADAFRAGVGCLFAPDPVDPLIVGPAEGSAPILVIGNTGDPATPFQWSVDMADFLSNAVLFTVDAEGHTAYGSFECVEPVVNAYLIDLELPAPGSSCSENASADYFPPAGESDLDQALAFFACLADQGLDVGEITAADLLADPTGETLFESIDFQSPATQAAVLACQSLLPNG